MPIRIGAGPIHLLPAPVFGIYAPESGRFFSPGAKPDKRLFDLPAFVLDRLARAGVTNAEWIGRDTLTEETAFFSNRRAVHRGQVRAELPVRQAFRRQRDHHVSHAG